MSVILLMRISCCARVRALVVCANAMSAVLIDYNEDSMVMTITLNRESRGLVEGFESATKFRTRLSSNALSSVMIGELLALFTVIRRAFQARVLHEAPMDDRGQTKPLPQSVQQYQDVIVRALIITGAGKVFCAGMDLRAVASTGADGTSGSDQNTEQVRRGFAVRALAVSTLHTPSYSSFLKVCKRYLCQRFAC
jgi:hypothetical protein